MSLRFASIAVFFSVLSFGQTKPTVIIPDLPNFEALIEQIKPAEHCHAAYDLLSNGHISLHVKDSTGKKLVRQAMSLALTYWAGIIDISVTQDDSVETCNLELAEAHNDDDNNLGWTYGPMNPRFDGVIYLNSTNSKDWTLPVLRKILIHELGHMFCLGHNADTDSVMYAYNDESGQILIESDLRELSIFHALAHPIHMVSEYAK